MFIPMGSYTFTPVPEITMALIKWDQSYSVKVNRCDDDHKKLFALINNLHDAMLTGKGGEVVQSVVQELLNYTKYHFTAEEALLEKAHYPGLSGHRAQHQEFVKRVEKFQQDIASSATGRSVDVLEFLKNWLSSHIKDIDQKYSSHLNAAGVC
jgi:hemerythrin